MLMASSLQINRFLYKFIHDSFIEWLLCARQNIRSWGKEIQEKKIFLRKRKQLYYEASLIAPKAFIIKVLHFLRPLDRFYGKSKTEKTNLIKVIS